MDFMLETKNLTKHFRIGRHDVIHAVDAVSLQIKEGEILGLVGESGSGKSTLGRAIVGLWDKTAGEVWYRGEKLPDQYAGSDFKRWSSEIQMIFQDPYSSLSPRMTVKEIIGEGLKLRGEKKEKQIGDEVAAWLERVSMHPDHMSRYPHEFSGGQRQRIGIARALIMRPKFVVCDEPISALDVSVQAQVINLLRDLKQSLGLTLLFIAHDLSMVRYVSSRMAVMYLGNIVELGPTDEVYFRPKHPYTQMLIQSNPEPDPKKERHAKKTVVPGEIPSPINLKAGCRFAGRCPKAMPHCSQKDPRWKQIGQDHFVACHLFESPS